MGKMTNLGYARLDSLVEDQGDEWLHDQLMCRLMEGERPTDIARSFAIPYVVLRGWMEKNCPDAVALAGRARADELEWKATNVVESAEVETVGLAKLQAEHYMKLAGKLDRAKYGDKDVSGGGSGITVVVERGGVVNIGENKDLGYQDRATPPEQKIIEGEVL